MFVVRKELEQTLPKTACPGHAVLGKVCLVTSPKTVFVCIWLRLSARHSLRHVAPVPVSMCPNLSANVVTSIGFQNLPRHREVVTLPNERLDSQHEGQFSECHLRVAEGIWTSDVFTILAM